MNLDGVDKPQIGTSRNIARDLLKKANIKNFPVLLKDVARHIPDLSIDGQELQDQLSGMQITYKGQAFIRYNSSHPTQRNRFTVAHEIGHLLLGHTSGCDRTEGRSITETEANQFAAELLMPLAMLKTAIGESKTVSLLAKKFWVSKDAMSNRVMETKLYTKLQSWE